VTRLSRTFVAALVLCALVAASACSNLPNLSEAEANAPGLEQTSYLYAKDGKRWKVVTDFHDEQNRVVVGYKKFPQVLKDAVISVEDQRFWEHPGVDARGVLRAAAEDFEAGGIVQGASTITMQYVKNTVGSSDQTMTRKFNEAVLAWQMEEKYTKEEILTKYLNTVYFGEGSYGAQAAAQRYFSRDVEKLTLPQAALLAGLISSPNEYDPISNKKKARVRRDIALDLMLDQGRISEEQHNKAVKGGLRLKPSAPTTETYDNAYFVDYVKRWFLSNSKFGTYDERVQLLFSGGLRIYSTVDPKLQRYADQAVNGTLRGSDPYGALAALDPRTGEILALVGGRDYFSRNDKLAKVNLATGGSTGRPTGSAAKMFTLVGALEKGISPNKGYSAPECVSIRTGDNEKPWKPCNAADGEAFGSISLSAATAASVNTVFAQVIEEIGPETWVDVALRMGIRCCRATAPSEEPLLPVLSATIGTNPSNPLEMASAYGTLAFGGRHVQPVPVSKITDADGNIIWQAKAEPRQVVDAKVAATAEKILEGVITGGTGTAANIGRPAFGKTGTGQNYTDAWFVGAVPQIATAVWVGYPEGLKSMSNTRIGTVFGGTWPAQIWREFMSKATRGLARENFPSGKTNYVTVEIDVSRNCLPNKYTPKGLIENRTFVDGEEPRKKCKQPTSFGLRPVPLLAGLSEKAAILKLKTLGFEADITESPGGKPFGFVLAQDPDAGVEWSTTKPVDITISVEKAKNNNKDKGANNQDE